MRIESEMWKFMNLIKYVKAMFIAVILIMLDQITKMLAVKYLMGNDGIDLISGVFRFQYLENRGSAFGMMQNMKPLFVIITIIVLVFISRIYGKIPDTKNMVPLKVISVVVFAGAIGNFIDRLKQSYVIDFLYFELIDFPIFNVADIYVTCSAAALIVLVLFYYKEDDFAWLEKKKGEDK